MGADRLTFVYDANGTLFGDLPAGGAVRIEANPAASGDEEVALDAAAMELGTD